VVRFRFLFDSVSADHNDFEGWYVDDVYVTMPATPPTIPIPAVLPVTGQSCFDEGSCGKR